MKAEHRKELETNALADRMGRVLETIKEKPQRGTVVYIVALVLLVVVAFMAVRWYRFRGLENSEAWHDLYVGNRKNVLEGHLEKPPGHAVRFDEAHAALWTCITRLAADARGSRDGLRKVIEQYEFLAKECEDDPVLAAEALYGIALAQETLAVEDRKKLENALENYQELAKNKKYSGSVYGQLAQQRVDVLTDDRKREEINRVYQDLELQAGFPFHKK